MAKIKIRTPVCPRNLGDKLRKELFSGDDNIYHFLADNIRDAREVTLSRYDQTARHSKDSSGKLRDLLNDHITFLVAGTNRISAGAIHTPSLPGYFKLQEEGTRPSSWQQQYRIVGIRKTPSKRGDYLILSSVSKELTGEYETETLTIYHPGIRARHFVLMGQDYLRKILGPRFKIWMDFKVSESRSK